MKILHTSDWHLGHTIYNYDRTEEQAEMLRQIEEIVKAQKPDVFLLCGDVYHTSQPSNAVQTMFANSLVKIHEANPGMTIVITAGNHDSGTKHDIFARRGEHLMYSPSETFRLKLALERTTTSTLSKFQAKDMWWQSPMFTSEICPTSSTSTFLKR